MTTGKTESLAQRLGALCAESGWAHGFGESRAMPCHADEGRIVADAYSLLPGDLRNTRACQAALEAAGFDPACPTYVLAECVLVYMEPGDSAAVVRWLGHWLPTAAFVVYEQVSSWPRQACARGWQSCTPRMPQ